MPQLLDSEGGLILVPVDSELLLLKVLPNGRVGKRVLSSVRFTDLEVPHDVDIVLAGLQESRDKARRVDVPPSSWVPDLGALLPGNPEMYIACGDNSATSSNNVHTSTGAHVASAGHDKAQPQPKSASILDQGNGMMAVPAVVGGRLEDRAPAGPLEEVEGKNKEEEKQEQGGRDMELAAGAGADMDADVDVDADAEALLLRQGGDAMEGAGGSRTCTQSPKRHKPSKRM